jgi:undecaprenyl-diphosphatase
MHFVGGDALHDLRWARDEALFHWLNGGAHPALDAAARIASSRLFCFGILALAELWVLARRRASGVGWVLAATAAIIATDTLGARILKPWFGRFRPCYALPAAQVQVLVFAGNSGSMPSLHSATAFAAATVLSFERPRFSPVYFGIAALIGWSRIREGVHWPSDVAAGALLGLLLGVGAWLLLKGAHQLRVHCRSKLPARAVP